MTWQKRNEKAIKRLTLEMSGWKPWYKRKWDIERTSDVISLFLLVIMGLMMTAMTVAFIVMIVSGVKK